MASSGPGATGGRSPSSSRRGNSVLAFDLRNHGASPWADGMAYSEMVEDVRASLHARDIDRAALLGHSMGGKVAMIMALLYPARSRPSGRRRHRAGSQSADLARLCPRHARG